MPAKIVVWNVQNFTINKINFNAQTSVAEPIVDPNGTVIRRVPLESMRIGYIVNNVEVADADIFVVIEVISSQGVKGSLLPSTSKGGQGAINLLQLLRMNISDFWMLVPPLKMVDKIVTTQLNGFLSLEKEGQYTEAVAVYYRSDRVDFTGPYVWPQTNNNNNPDKTPVPQNQQNPVVTQDYPQPWSWTLPPNTHYAGQFEYRINGSELLFPGPGSRRPFTTQFRERGGLNRIITLVAVHYPPLRSGTHNGDAEIAFTQTMEYFGPNNYQIQPNEVVLIAGDYNLNAFPAAQVEGIFQIAHRLYGFYPFFVDRNAKPSMYKAINEATAPDFGYINLIGLDNFAYRVGANLVNTPVKGAMLNRVEGLTNPPVSRLMENSVEFIETLQQPLQNDVFRRPQNFGTLGPAPGTSDHMAMYLTF